MARKRSKLEMYLDVLENVDSGVNKPTNIMYKCNLSWVPMQEILDSMIEKNLIREVEKGNKRTYEITEKGQDMLRYLQNVVNVLGTQKQKRPIIANPSTKSMFVTRLGRGFPSISQDRKPAESDSS